VSIRFRVILPYLLLTALVAILGVYVVTRLVSSTLSERLNNQLLEAGRVVSDSVVRQELRHVDVGRLVAYTKGVAEAILEGNEATLASRVQPLAAGLAAENVAILDLQGREMFQTLLASDGRLQVVETPSGLSDLDFVQAILSNPDPQQPPQRGIARQPFDDQYYYYTAVPVILNNQVVGVVIVGTSLNTLLPYLKSTALADVVIYDAQGRAIATSMAAQNQNPAFLQSLALAPDEYEELTRSSRLVQGENFRAEGRWYSLARGVLQVGGSRVAVYAVVLPAEYVIQPGAASRNLYVLIFTAAMLAVIIIGYLISRRITHPLYALVRTSQAISKGDLSQRSGIRGKDEIGTLAATFDEMTSRLQERTAELERTYHILEQMDRTKASFIDVSAHELRSPLTSVKGYAQIIELKTKDNPELKPLTANLIDGVDRMTEIVNNMLDVTRIDSKALELLPTPVQMNAILMRVQKTFQKSLEERQIGLHVEGLGELPLINVDPDLMYKVFYHLVMNAIKYTPDGGHIYVRGRIVRGNAQPPEMEIVVEDTGIGVAKEHQEAIFEKFFQTGEVLFHSSGKTKFKGGGPGLGLAIVRGIVEAHQGRIWVESPGYDETTCPGSKFFVRMPLDGVRKP
jgi:signal transduction histidine kinase